jgi:hypothetical protein
VPEVVDGGHQVALVQVEGVGQLLLGQGAEVIEGAEDGVVDQRETALSQARLQVAAAVPGHWCDDSTPRPSGSAPPGRPSRSNPTTTSPAIVAPTSPTPTATGWRSSTPADHPPTPGRSIRHGEAPGSQSPVIPGGRRGPRRGGAHPRRRPGHRARGPAATIDARGRPRPSGCSGSCGHRPAIGRSAPWWVSRSSRSPRSTPSTSGSRTRSWATPATATSSASRHDHAERARRPQRWNASGA